MPNENHDSFKERVERQRAKLNREEKTKLETGKIRARHIDQIHSRVNEIIWQDFRFQQLVSTVFNPELRTALLYLSQFKQYTKRNPVYEKKWWGKRVMKGYRQEILPPKIEYRFHVVPQQYVPYGSTGEVIEQPPSEAIPLSLIENNYDAGAKNNDCGYLSEQQVENEIVFYLANWTSLLYFQVRLCYLSDTLRDSEEYRVSIWWREREKKVGATSSETKTAGLVIKPEANHAGDGSTEEGGFRSLDEFLDHLANYAAQKEAPSNYVPYSRSS